MHQGIKTASAATADAVVTKTSAGLLAGAIVMTMEGELPIEHIAPGDRIITRDTGVAVLKEMRIREEDVACIRIKAGSLGHTRPDRDMVVAPDTLIHLRDWRAEALFGAKQVLVKASRLADGEFVAEQSKMRVKIYEMVFDKQHIIYADGVEMASASV
ncbi:Hint domain-containing protein [Marivivens marinus]|uniref:Hint domain-containing protein n=1 Tax=Marivivens marinus TaxID=3110173 RepID=UPI003B846A10